MMFREIFGEFQPQKNSRLYGAVKILETAETEFRAVRERELELGQELADTQNGGPPLDWNTKISPELLDALQHHDTRVRVLQSLISLAQAEGEKRLATFRAAKLGVNAIVNPIREQQRVIKEAEQIMTAAQLELKQIEEGAHRSPQPAQARFYQAKAAAELAQAELKRLITESCTA